MKSLKLSLTACSSLVASATVRKAHSLDCNACKYNCGFTDLSCPVKKAACFSYVSIFDLNDIVGQPMMTICDNDRIRMEGRDRINDAISMLVALGIVGYSEFSDVRVRFCSSLQGNGWAPSPNQIYLHSDNLHVCPGDLAVLLAHEYYHIRQWRQWESNGFKCRYAHSFSEGGGFGENNAVEQAAYAFERQANSTIGNRCYLCENGSCRVPSGSRWCLRNGLDDEYLIGFTNDGGFQWDYSLEDMSGVSGEPTCFGHRVWVFDEGSSDDPNVFYIKADAANDDRFLQRGAPGTVHTNDLTPWIADQNALLHLRWRLFPTADGRYCLFNLAMSGFLGADHTDRPNFKVVDNCADWESFTLEPYLGGTCAIPNGFRFCLQNGFQNEYLYGFSNNGGGDWDYALDASSSCSGQSVWEFENHSGDECDEYYIKLAEASEDRFLQRGAPGTVHANDLTPWIADQNALRHFRWRLFPTADGRYCLFNLAMGAFLGADHTNRPNFKMVDNCADWESFRLQAFVPPTPSPTPRPTSRPTPRPTPPPTSSTTPRTPPPTPAALVTNGPPSSTQSPSPETTSTPGETPEPSQGTTAAPTLGTATVPNQVSPGPSKGGCNALFLAVTTVCLCGMALW